MPQLVQLIRADGLGGNAALQIFDIPLAGGQGRHARSGEGNLGGGGEEQHVVLGALLQALCIQVQQCVRRVGQVVDAIGVVPHDAEVLGGGLQGREPPNGLVGIGDARGVGILGHAPTALDGVILCHQPLDQVHIRPGLQHGDRDHLKAEILRHREMAVIAGGGTQEFDLFLAGPRGTAAVAVGKALRDAVEHHLQAGVVPQDDLVRGDVYHLAEDGAHLRQAVPHTVVPAVIAVGVGKLAAGVQGL